MSSNNIVLPNEVIHLILLYCQTANAYLSQSLVNFQWACEARRLRSIMKARFARKIILVNRRFILWYFDIRVTVIGHAKNIQRHGLEEFVQAYHRVGGPGVNVYYLERHWQDGRLHGLEIVREINGIWYTKYSGTQVDKSNEIIAHPYDGLIAVDSMKKYGRHHLVPKADILHDGCDYLGKILFKYEWTSITLEDSEQIRRSLIDDNGECELRYLYDFVNAIDLHEISLQGSCE